MTGLSVLLSAKWRSLLNALIRADGLKMRVLVVGVLGVGFWAGLFGASYWFLDQSQRIEIFGDVLVEQLLAMSLLVVFSVLVFSNLVSSFSAYFLAEDLGFLMARPIRPYSFYSARFVELLVQSSWMVGLFSLPIFISLGVVYRVSAGYYVGLGMLLLPLFVIATALATLVSLVMTNVLPARRTREVLLLLAALLFVALFVVVRSLRPERFLNPDERAGMVEVLATLSAPRASLLPSEWVHRVLWPQVVESHGPTNLYVGCLYATAAGLFFLGAWLFRALHFDGYSKACEGRIEGSAPERWARRLLRRRMTARERGERHLSQLGGRQRPLAVAAAMGRKDARTFIRDTAQWTQLILLAALVVIYLLNFNYIQTVGEGGFIGPLGLYFINLSLSTFVIAAISVRFIFPTVSLEGRAFWMIRSAPVTARSFLLAKWRSGTPGVCLFGLGLTLCSNAMIGASPALHLCATVFEVPATIGVVGLGVGLGAVFPRFDSNNAAKIATGFGGFSYMVTGVFLNLVIVGLSYPTTRAVLNLVEGGTSTAAGPPGTVVAATALAAVGLPLLVAWVAVRVGAKRLERA